MAADDLADNVDTEAPALQKTHVARALLGGRGRGLEFALPDPSCRCNFAGLQIFTRHADRVFRNAFFLQLVGYALGTEPPAPRLQHLLDDARFGQPPALLEVIEQLGYFRRIFGERPEFGLKLAA